MLRRFLCLSETPWIMSYVTISALLPQCVESIVRVVVIGVLLLRLRISSPLARFREHPLRLSLLRAVCSSLASSLFPVIERGKHLLVMIEVKISLETSGF